MKINVNTQTSWEASAASNIAIIKYMGKIDAAVNRPAHASLSYTLEHLRTFVRLTPAEEGEQRDSWAPLKENSASGQNLMPIELSLAGQNKFLKFAEKLKNQMGLDTRYFKIQSANTFPSDCGLASSASSFAALTQAMAEVARSQTGRVYQPQELAQFSRAGSGSSCRSFFGPWAKWHDLEVEAREFPFSRLLHAVAVVESGKKEVSSSLAHQRVLTSLLFQGRVQRVTQRLDLFEGAMEARDWNRACAISWAEFWDMHALFETSEPSFGYMTGRTLDVLHRVRELRQTSQDGPMVTMDAGANIHFLFREDQRELYDSWIEKFPGVDWWTSTAGRVQS